MSKAKRVRKISIQHLQDQTLLEGMRAQGLNLEAPCGGKGLCGKCKVKVTEDNLGILEAEEVKHLTLEEIHTGHRLACLYKPQGPLSIDYHEEPHADTAFLETEGFVPDHLNPSYVKRLIHTAPDMTGCFYQGRAGDSQSEIKIGEETGDTVAVIFGASIDIGTTTVVGNLINLHTGVSTAMTSRLNPQKDFGLDVLSRIEYQNSNPEGLRHLHRTIIGCINDILTELSEEAGIQSADIYDLTIAANTVMIHLFLNLSAETLGKSPYTSLVSGAVETGALELGISISPMGRVWVLPPISAFIGGDITAGILATKLYRLKNRTLLIDIGTNGELVLMNHGQMAACSCAAGPALEGMNISCGMRAAAGAVEGIRFTADGVVEVQVIGNVPAGGICGSGIIDFMAEAVKARLVGKTGRIVKSADAAAAFQHLIGESDGGRFIGIPCDGSPLRISQNDIRQIQLAKGAILSGIYALTDWAGLELDDLDEVIIAGQFGKHLKVESLVELGIIPGKLRGKVHYVGNASLKGALLCLTDQGARETIGEIAQEVTYLELAAQDGYDRLFAKCLNFY